MKIAVMFAGQGSQYSNMGLDFLVKEKNIDKVKIANDILGYDVLTAIENKNNELSETKYTQPLIAVISMLIYDEVLESGAKVEGLLGFSLGEVVALYATKILTFEDVLKLVKVRAEAMDEITSQTSGKMAAVLNFDEQTIIDVCNEISKTNLVQPVNYNSKKQLVISGTKDGVDLAINKLKELGARRIVELNVSGAFHTNLMSEAGTILDSYTQTLKINKEQLPLYLNSSTNILEASNLNKELAKQVQSPVLFYQSIEKMIQDGFTHFIEVGPGNVLTQLVSRNNEGIVAFNVEKNEDLIKLEGVI